MGLEMSIERRRYGSVFNFLFKIKSRIYVFLVTVNKVYLLRKSGVYV